jgi:microcystin-dependent protein
MSLCGCYPGCACQLNVEPPSLLSISGNGDPATGGWTITASETAFSASNTDGAVEITPSGTYGHSPTINLRLDDSPTVNLSTSPNGLRADLINIPSSSGGVPTGVIISFFGQEGATPSGWLICAGQLEDIASYPDLFAITGHAGNGGVDPGAGQFRIPDLRGRVEVGKDNMGGIDANRIDTANVVGTPDGLKDSTLGLTNLPSHDHTSGSLVVSTGISGSGLFNTSGGGGHNHSPAAAGGDTATPHFVVAGNDGSIGGVLAQTGGTARVVKHNLYTDRGVTDTEADHVHAVDRAFIASGLSLTSGSVTGSTGPAGSVSPTPVPIMQPHIIVNKIIKT